MPREPVFTGTVSKLPKPKGNRPSDRTCEKCKNSTLIVEGKDTVIPHQLLTCRFGSNIFTECQTACTNDYFESRR
ncbi:MAG: hypothetical protein A2Y34_03920 [Spirochaetes bacterium GWC1_27_15]|nr:MAG: hypothetical protein A2Y34_03920 [Spirochaetes bacterium GWC1_27_15]